MQQRSDPHTWLNICDLSIETGGICIAPRPAEEGAPILPTMAMRPFYGIQMALMGERVS